MAAAAPQQRADALEARLEAMSLPESGPVWLRSAREGAMARLRAMGLPGRRDEYWRFTDPARLNAPAPLPAPRFEIGERPVFDIVDRLRLVFVDGVLEPRRSDPLAMEHVEITPLTDAPDLHWAAGLYGALEGAGQLPVARPHAALNTAVAVDGLLIRVTGRAPRPISLIYHHAEDLSDALLHHVIRLEPGAELTILENGPVSARLNKVMEVDVGAGATFHHVRAQGRDHQRQAITHVFARLAEDSVFKSFTLTANGAITRNEAVVEFTGPGASAHMAGAAVG
ncbi:MAG: SufD family Fe-S cluster assembly protein, partial [Rhodobacteraceae bacterium]|nr:SufD family Fe-S cluster assembly protein [Paracoccaceae bacterium]